MSTACHSIVTRWDSSTLDPVEVIKTTFGSIHSLVISREYIVCGTYNRVNIAMIFIMILIMDVHSPTFFNKYYPVL
jgi:hypothetical protein